MGCRTGFYMSLIGSPSEDIVAKAWEESMKDILDVDTIPEANKYQCGTSSMHSIDEAKAIAKKVLESKIGKLDNEKLYLSDDKLKALEV
jgi:S-ribosylhomocysteine lyase